MADLSNRHDVDTAIVLLASAQHGVVSYQQLRACGLSSSAIEWRADHARLHRVHPSVYAVGHTSLSRIASMYALILALGAGAAISHGSALELWNVWRPRTSPIDALCIRRSAGYHGARVRQTRSLHPRDVVTRRGLPVATMARTLVDLGNDLQPLQLANVMHEADHRRLLNETQLVRTMRRLRTSNGHPCVAAALELRRTGSVGTRSELERRFLLLLERCGIEPPLTNVRVAVAGGSVEVDFVWPAIGLCIELDGAGHSRARTRRDDQARDALLRSAGHRVLRVAGLELDLDPTGLMRAIRLALHADPASPIRRSPSMRRM